MAAIRKACRITMDTLLAAAIHVHRKNGTIMTFKEYRSGLYFSDAGSSSTKLNNKTKTTYMFLNTAAGNKTQYTQHKIQGADNTRDTQALYQKFGHPLDTTYIQILQTNCIQNCPVTPDETNGVLIIYGPEIATLKGNRPRDRTMKYQITTRYRYQLQSSRNIKPYTFSFFGVNGNLHFRTISQWIKFCKVAPIQNWTKQTLLVELSQQ